MSTPIYLRAIVEKRKLTREESASLVFVQVYLERTRTAKVLRRLRDKRKNLWSTEADALLDAAIHLESDADRCAREAMHRGQLLYCHPGTTVLQGGAA